MNKPDSDYFALLEITRNLLRQLSENGTLDIRERKYIAQIDNRMRIEMVRLENSEEN